MKKILSLFLCVVICFSLSFPVFADFSSQTSRYDTLSFWDQALLNGVDLTSNLWFGKSFQGLAGLMSGKVCSYSDDGYHHASTLLAKGRKDGDHYVSPAKCKYCGKEFFVYSDDLKSAYDSYNGSSDGRKFSKVDSSGGLYYVPQHMYLATYFSKTDGLMDVCSHYAKSSDFHNSNKNVKFNCSALSVSAYPDDGGTFVACNYARIAFKLTAPVDGFYSLVNMPTASSFIDSGNARDTSGYKYSGSAFYSAGSSKTFSFRSVYGQLYPSYIIVRFNQPIFKVEPAVTVSGYTPDTRFSNLNGSLGYMDSSGKLTLINNTQIINETTNVYYNPITNNTQNITNWTYDYSDRSYHVTFEDNSVTNITYNDEYITINEGDTVYNIYYIVQNPDACDHDYTSAVTKEPTCLETGTRTYTCSKCHKAYDERIAAKGHTWELKETVKSEYNESGELITQGFTIYQCSVCGEQYKDIDGTGPPMPKPDDSGGSGDSSGIIDWLKKIYDAVKNINVDVNISGSEETDNKTWIDGFIGKFGWLHSVYEIGESFARDIVGDQAAAVALADNPDAQIAGPAAPNITADLSAAASPYGHVYGTGEITVLDLSWYTPYKPTVDKLISGFLWIAFLWGLFKRAPDIISGAGITENKIDDLKGGKR